MPVGSQYVGVESNKNNYLDLAANGVSYLLKAADLLNKPPPGSMRSIAEQSMSITLESF